MALLAELDGRLAGSFSLMELTRRPAYGEIGYWVALEARGRGVARRAVTLLREWAAEALRLRTIEILAHRDNAPSRAVARRGGFAETGELRPLPRGGEDAGPPVHIVYVWEA